MAKNTVGANGQSIVTEKSGGQVTCFPNVCKTPVGSSVVPIPYPSVAKSGYLKKGSKTVKIGGAPACLKGSNLSKSIGDEAGTAKGVASGKQGGIAEPVNYSFNVKIEGKNVVRAMDPFISNNKNTPPAPIIQAPVVAVNPELKVDEGKDTFKCDWKLCKGDHPEEVEYPDRDKGSVERGNASSGKGYEQEWIDAGLEPWVLNGPGKNIKRVESDYTDDVDATKPKTRDLIDKALSLPSNEYVTQKHHLISVALFKGFPYLAHNAQLVGYNVNDKENGACFPYFRIDMLRHNLQCHRGGHPKAKYNARLKIRLESLDEACKDFCTTGDQETLIDELNELSADVREFLNDWESSGWCLRTNPKADKEWASNRINS